jgi:hypothetical protein
MPTLRSVEPRTSRGVAGGGAFARRHVRSLAWALPLALAFGLPRCACKQAESAAGDDALLPAPTSIPAAPRGAVGAHMPTARAALPRIPVVLTPLPSSKPARRNDAGVAAGSEGVPL